jgi:hypothetical protein
VNSPNAVIDGIQDTAGIAVNSGDSLTLKNSSTGLINDSLGAANLTVLNSTLNGGNQWTYSTITGGDHITVKNSNLSGGGHEILCYADCDVENNYLHDNANGQAAGAHQNSFFSGGGSNFTIVHNSVYCVGGCTADIAFIPNDNVNNGLVNKNLLVTTLWAAYCLYPSSDPPGKPGIVSQMTITNNVFQHGSNGKCATYGPVAGWDTPNNNPGTDGYGNVWSGNTWDDGSALNP